MSTKKITKKAVKVNKARFVHNKVKVSGKEYNSTRAAFEALKLPMGRHITFRLRLKKEKKAVFEHGKRKVAFTLMAAA